MYSYNGLFPKSYLRFTSFRGFIFFWYFGATFLQGWGDICDFVLLALFTDGLEKYFFNDFFKGSDVNKKEFDLKPASIFTQKRQVSFQISYKL